jgi:hypothetical protein
MNKPRLIFIFLSFYIVLAFGWWGFEHFRNSKNINNLEIQYSKLKAETDEILCYKASSDIFEEIRQDNFLDTNQLKKYFNQNYSQLEIVFMDSVNPFNSYLIRPKVEAYQKIEVEEKESDIKLLRKKWMYATEGLVMMALFILFKLKRYTQR